MPSPSSERGGRFDGETLTRPSRLGGSRRGRWSLVDHFDSNGRRYLMAHRNDPDTPDLRGLTLRERQVVGYAGAGHSNKIIAYELGLTLSTVAGHLARARAKLGLPSSRPSEKCLRFFRRPRVTTRGHRP